MEELEKKQGQDVNSQEGAEPVTANEQVNDEGLNDDQDPLETLRQVAEELGVKDVKLLTEKELRSIIDKEVSKAIKTREENIRKEEERKRLQEQGKYEEILKLERKEMLDTVKETYVQMYNIPEELAELIDTKALAELPLNEGKQAIQRTAEAINKLIESAVEERLSKRIAEVQRTAFKPVENSNPTDIKSALKERFKNFG